MLEYQIIVNVYVPAQGGRSVRSVIRSSDRDQTIKKFQYLDQLVKDKRKQRELQEWTSENLNLQGIITSIEGLYGVAYILITK